MTMAETIDKKRIAKNTIFLYIRMFISMAVGIFTSRVTLEYLGITDYGIYQSVGGIVGLVAFANTAISTGISRFITFGLGERNLKKLKRLFSTLISTQIAFILILVIIAETVGLWFVTHRLVIPAEAMDAAIFTYHLSIITMALSMLANPFNATIIAHERMHIYAYITLVNTFATLGAAYLLTIIPTGRLYLYSSALFIISVGTLLFEIIYSRRSFQETTFKLTFDRKIIKEIAGFSGWSLVAALSISLNNQGILVLLNMFFSPAIVAARAVSLTINNAANQFVGNFRTAMNPQIVKQYAAGNFDESKTLLLSSTKISFFLMLVLCVPIFYTADSLLSVWLKKVPEYSSIFLKLVIIQSLFQIFDVSFYTALYAKGQLRENALISPVLGLLCFPIVYILFKHGASPVSLSWVMLIYYAILGIIVKPILLVKIVDYHWNEIIPIILRCLLVAIIAFSLSFIINDFYTTPNGWNRLLILAPIFALLTAVIVYVIGFSPTARRALNEKMSIFCKKILNKQAVAL